MKATALQWLRSKFPRLAPQNISIPLYLFQALDSINKLPVEQQAQFLIDSIKNNPEGKIKVVEIHEKLHFIKADEIIGEKSYNKYFIINQGNLSLNHELLKPLNYSLELASNTTKVDLDSLSKSDQRLVNLVRLAKEEGLKESDIYETYLKRYKEKLDLPSDTIKSFLSSQDQITCQIVDEKVIYFQKGEEENGEDTPSSNAAVVVDDHTTKQIDESDTSSKFQKAQPSPIRNKANNEKKIVNYLRYNILKRYFTALGETHFSFENQQYIALDLEGFNETLTDYSLAQLSLGDGTSAILFDHQQGKEDVQKALLSHLTNAKDLQYIFIHACHSDVAALSSSFVDDLHRNNKCFIDTQLVYEFFHQNRFNSFSDCLEFFNPSSQTKDENSRKYLIKSKMRNDPHYWHRRPLSLEQIQYAALDVVSLHQTIPLILEKIERLGQEMNVNLLSVFLRATEKRIANVFKGIQHTVVFDEETFHPISRELAESLAEHLPDSKYSRLINQFDRSIQSISSTARLLKLFPERYLPFLDIPILNTSVCDIVLDKGRAPFLRMMDNSRQDLFPDQPEYKFTRDDLVSIIENLNGGFGSDNRTGVEGELHRISAIRSKKAVSPRNPHDNIIGLTIRIGRYFVGNSYIISDLLFQEMHRGKSILVLGPPGSGKTSVIREIARQMSRVHHVMIVDTSNEICGDSDVPHDCVGNARRMVVPEIDDQHRVMIECVQNHTPEVMIIDEIGRTKEVKAAQTCKQRGVRLIASAHGDLRSLLKNGELNGLLGGVVPVILGDVAANKTKSGKKVIEQRGGAPIFDIIIEVIKGNYSAFRITTDSGKAVDLLLDGREGNAEYRERRTIASVNKDESPSQIIQTSFVKI